jgi:hypothetical protein
LEERDMLANNISRTRQNAVEQIASAENRASTLNNQLRDALQRGQQFEAMVVEVRSLLRSQPDVLAAVRQKVGLQN